MFIGNVDIKLKFFLKRKCEQKKLEKVKCHIKSRHFYIIRTKMSFFMSFSIQSTLLWNIMCILIKNLHLHSPRYQTCLFYGKWEASNFPSWPHPSYAFASLYFLLLNWAIGFPAPSPPGRCGNQRTKAAGIRGLTPPGPDTAARLTVSKPFHLTMGTREHKSPLMVCLFTLQVGLGRALNAYFPLGILSPVFSFLEAWGKIMFHILKINTAFTEV